jgi:hypothetical protein
MVLPARLPGSRPKETAAIDRALTQRLRRACDFVSNQFTDSRSKPTWQSLAESLDDCYVLNNGSLDEAALVAALRVIGEKTLMLHVNEQNAGLLIYRDPM